MDGLLLILTFLILAFFGISLRSFYHYIQDKQELKSKVKQVITSEFQFDTEEKSASEKYMAKVFYFADDLSSLGHRINFFSESEDVERWLMYAGYPYELTTERFQGLKMFVFLLGFFLGVIFFILGMPLAVFGMLLFPLIGYMMTVFWLKGMAKKRQEELTFGLPDFLDTVSVTLQAGLSLDQALKDITPFFDGPIREEFTRFSQRISLGVSREEAYYELLRRNDSPEFQQLIKSLIQGTKLGVPVSSTFKIQADEMRKLKKEKTKELAAKASPKITLITTFVVTPTAMILIGGLMVLNLIFGDNSILNLF